MSDKCEKIANQQVNEEYWHNRVETMSDNNNSNLSDLNQHQADDCKKRKGFNWIYLAVGSGLGLAFGIPSSNPPIGIAIGIGVGMVLGFIIRKKESWR